MDARDRALAAHRVRNRDAELGGETLQRRVGLREVDAAAGQDQRPAGRARPARPASAMPAGSGRDPPPAAWRRRRDRRGTRRRRTRTRRGRCPRGRPARQGPDGPTSRSSTPVAPARGCACPPRCAGTPCRPARAAAAGGLLGHSLAGMLDVRCRPPARSTGSRRSWLRPGRSTRLVAPGPSVPSQIPTRPVTRAYASAMNAPRALVVHQVVLEPRVVDRRVEGQQLESPHAEDRPGLVGVQHPRQRLARPRARAVPPRRPLRGWQARSQRGLVPGVGKLSLNRE